MNAGNFSDWLRAMRTALAGGVGMDVACGTCVGCCTSSYFVKVRAHEKAALEHIGSDNLRPVPGATNGNMLMGFDEQGHCFMFANGGCSIYQHRPETCRTYDCRVFTAAGMNAGPGKSEINERISRWSFDYPNDRDREEHRAVTAAANFMRQHPVPFPGGRIPSRPSEIAVLAVKSYEVFLDTPPSDAEIAAAIVAACRAFDAAKS
jgi:Fe-S-cluster containining protein